LSGLPGIGKTQTAIEYAYRHGDEYITVLWAKAESRETLTSSFVAIAELLNLPGKNAQEQNIVVAAVKRWLENNTSWLLIFDNADDLALAREFLPSGGKGHVLLTTRAQTTGGIAQRVEIEEMELEEGALFLLRRAKMLAQDAPLDVASTTDQTKAKTIVKELGGLPLALDQAGAFIEEVPSSLDEYLELYRKEGAKLLAERGGIISDHPSVATTFSLAFKQVADRSPAAADLIRVCAFLAPDAIPEEVFTLVGAAELGDNLAKLLTSSLEFVLAIKEAGRFSLIDRNPANQSINIHRLVQEVVKNDMDDATQRLWAERTIRAMAQSFLIIENDEWPRREWVLAHAQVCIEHVKKWQLEFPEAALWFHFNGYYLHKYTRYVEAETFYQQALAMREKMLGPEHRDVVATLSHLARNYYAQGQFAQSESLWWQILEISKKTLDPMHPDLAAGLTGLATVYQAQGQLAEAEQIWQWILAISEKTLDPMHPDLAVSLNGLATLYHTVGQYAQAESLYQRALAIKEKSSGPEHPDVATILNNLAESYRKQSQFAQAEPLYQRALAIREKKLGSEHPIVATVLGNYAVLLRKTNRKAEAEKLEARAQAIRAKHTQENQK